MAEVIRMPEVMTGAEEATLASWSVAEGDTVTEGATLAEVETDKAAVELPLEVSGVVGKLLIGAGETVTVGAPIAVILESADESFDTTGLIGRKPDAEPAASQTPTQPTTSIGEPDSRDSRADARPASAPRSAGSDGPHPRRLFATPLVRRLARQNGVDLAEVTGTGPHGRIVRRDLEVHLLGREAVPQPAAPAPAAASPDVAAAGTKIPHTPMRRAIARRLSESKSTVPHFYLRARCRVGPLLELRAQVNEVSPTKVSVNDLVVRAVASALKSVPEANAIWTDEAMVRFDTVDIAVAVSTPSGLLTPVVRNVADKSVSAISRELSDLAKRAREGRLRQFELEGGCFTVSNLGMYGVEEFAAIINPPHSGILAVGAARSEPVVEDEEMRIRSVMDVTLSADHRVIDGAVAATWLSAFVDAVENPMTLLI